MDTNNRSKTILLLVYMFHVMTVYSWYDLIITYFVCPDAMVSFKDVNKTSFYYFGYNSFFKNEKCIDFDIFLKSSNF